MKSLALTGRRRTTGTDVKTKTRPHPCLRRPALRGVLSACAAALLLGACAGRPLNLNLNQSQQALPEGVRVPAGHQAVLRAQSSGNLSYECQAVRRAPFEYAWLLRNRNITLTDSNGNNITHLPGARASWTHSDGSRLLAREFIEVPNGPHNLPLQRYTAESFTPPGALRNISYVQRVNTVGGWISVTPCSSAELGMRMSVPFEAEFVFWRPAGT